MREILEIIKQYGSYQKPELISILRDNLGDTEQYKLLNFMTRGELLARIVENVYNKQKTENT